MVVLSGVLNSATSMSRSCTELMVELGASLTSLRKVGSDRSASDDTPLGYAEKEKSGASDKYDSMCRRRKYDVCVVTRSSVEEAVERSTVSCVSCIMWCTVSTPHDTTYARYT